MSHGKTVLLKYNKCPRLIFQTKNGRKRDTMTLERVFEGLYEK